MGRALSHRLGGAAGDVSGGAHHVMQVKGSPGAGQGTPGGTAGAEVGRREKPASS